MVPLDETDLPREIAGQRTLDDVVNWTLARRPVERIVDVIVQDEFTHDIVVTFGDRWLVYDTT
jgi:hypothetical protein